MTAATPSPKKSLGQHFLSDPNILSRIVDLAGVEAGDAVLEIGPGPGGLTRALSQRGAEILAVEADGRMVEHLLALEIPGLTVVHGDALKTGYRELSTKAGRKFKLVANLPYNISGPLTALLLKERAAFTSMTLMYQKEVAQRIAASPGGKERGTLSALAQAFCEVKMGFKVPPGAFRPPPKVDSSLLTLKVLDAPIAPLEDEELFWAIIHEAFQKRRKQLKNGLRHRLADDEFFKSIGMSGMERPEELSSLQWITIANALYIRDKGKGS